jgi:hypothetical protein
MTTMTAARPGTDPRTDPATDPRPRKWTAAGRRVIGLDGEGNDIGPELDRLLDSGQFMGAMQTAYDWKARHSYTLLAAADDGGWKEHVSHDGSQRPGTDETRPNYGLPTKTCFEFCLDMIRDPSDLVFGFSFTYDSVMMICDLPLKNLIELSRHESTEWEGYLIQFRPRKYLKIAVPRYGKIRCADGTHRYRRSVTVWDSFGYFQMSFVEALSKSKALFTKTELDMLPMIAKMKKLRSQMAGMSKKRILVYCYAEVRLLAKMMRDVIVSTETYGVFPSSFYGSSAIAGPWMQDHRVQDFIGDAGLPHSVIDASYFGGRFENRGVGQAGTWAWDRLTHDYVRTAYSADIRSAYPYQLVRLPCLAHATSRRVTDLEPGKWGVYLVGSDTSGPWAPFPIRIPADVARADRASLPDGKEAWLRALTNKQVLFAHGGKRWVWQDEVAVARKHFGAEAIPVYDGYVIETHCDEHGCSGRPFAAVQDLYDERARIKKEMKRTGIYNGLEKVLKLLINSIYGKTAQSVGWQLRKGVTRDQVREAIDAWEEAGRTLEAEPDWESFYEPPEMLCRAWAAMITSGTRAMIFDIMMQSGGAVCSTATDGLISDQPLAPILRNVEGPDLGQWELDTFRDVVLYQNGVYTYQSQEWDDAASALVWKGHMKSRGFSPQDITAEMLRETWDSGLWEVTPKDGSRAFIPLKLAMTRKDKLGVLGEWARQKRPVDFMPTKRWLRDNPMSEDERAPWLETDTRVLAPDVMSMPYVPKSSPYLRALEDAFIGDDEEDGDMPLIHPDDEIELAS